MKQLELPVHHKLLVPVNVKEELLSAASLNVPEVLRKPEQSKTLPERFLDAPDVKSPVLTLEKVGLPLRWMMDNHQIMNKSLKSRM